MERRSLNAKNLCATALLIAVGIVIPMYSPVKIVMPPASFTLASHVAIFIAMAISPGVAVAVSLGTTLGFFLGGFPLVIVLRAATHVVWALLGAMVLQRKPELMNNALQARAFSLVVGVVHALLEVAVVAWFYAGGQLSASYYENGFFRSVVLLVGIGGLVHSLVDYELSLAVIKVLQRQRGIKSMLVGTR